MSGFQLAARNRVAIAAAPMATPDGPLRVLTTSTQKPSTIAPASAVLARSTSFGCDMKVKPPTSRLGPRQPATYGIPVSVVVMDAPLTTCGRLVCGDLRAVTSEWRVVSGECHNRLHLRCHNRQHLCSKGKRADDRDAVAEGGARDAQH